jgi:hypothetical protein
MAFWKGAAGIVALVSLGGCQILSGLDDLEVRGGEVSASSASSASAGGGGGMDPCGSGGCNPEFLVGTLVPVHFIAVDSEHVYWAWKGSSPGGGYIYRAALNGPGSPELLIKNVEPVGLVVNDSTKTLYWIDAINAGSGVYSVKSVSTSDVGIITDVDTSASVADWRALTKTPDGQIFWADAVAKQILKADAGLHFSDTGAPFVIAPDATNLYWFDGDSIDTGLIAGMGHVKVATAVPDTYGVAVDDKFVYWTENVENGLVWASSKNPMMGEVFLAAAVPRPSHIIAAGKFIYYAVQQAPFCEQGAGMIMRLPAGLSGGVPVPVVGGQVCPSHFVQTDDYVYWGSVGTIYRIAK